jgi:hypothetical protein
MVHTDAPSQPLPAQPPCAAVHGGPGLVVVRVTPLSWLAGQPTPVTRSTEVIRGTESDGATASPDVSDEHRVGRQGRAGLGRRERLLREMRPFG